MLCVVCVVCVFNVADRKQTQVKSFAEPHEAIGDANRFLWASTSRAVPVCYAAFDGFTVINVT